MMFGLLGFLSYLCILTMNVLTCISLPLVHTQVPLNTNAETTLASLQSAEDHSEIQVAEPKHLDDNNDEVFMQSVHM